MARKPGSFGATTEPMVRETASRLISEQGYAAVSMRQIAGEIGLQAGALYSYTKDKQSLLCDLIIQYLDGRLADWRAREMEADPTAHLEQFCRFHLSYSIKKSEGARLVDMELRNLTPENRARVDAALEDYEKELRKIIARGAEANRFTVPSPEMAARAVLGLLRGVASWADGENGLPPRRVVRISWNMVRRSVGAKGYQ